MQCHYDTHSLKPGIYRILNTQTNRIYVGQAKRFKERWSGHKSSLLRNKHQSKFLQADFSKCRELLGHDDFLEFHVLEVMEGTSKEERNKREDFWIAEHKKLGFWLYNHIEVNFGLEHVYSHNPASTRLKKSENLKKRWKEDGNYTARMTGERHPCYGKARSQEVKEKISNANAGNRAFLGRKHSAKTKMIQSQKAIGRTISEGQRQKQSSKMKGKKLSEGHKIKLRAYKPRAKRYDIKLISPNGVIYGPVTNMALFCKEHKLQATSMSLLVRCKQKQHKGWSLFG